MTKAVALQTGEIAYTLKTSERLRTVRLTIYADGRVVVTAPPMVAMTAIERLVQRKSAWIANKLAHFKRAPQRTVIHVGRNGLREHKDRALALVSARLAHFNAFYGLRFNKVMIKQQKSRWGSCSKKQNLNFNYKIAFLPSHLADYIIVHELCHLAEFNHSKVFWAHVARALPQWRALRKELARFTVR